jgi:hypothetical protein
VKSGAVLVTGPGVLTSGGSVGSAVGSSTTGAAVGVGPRATGTAAYEEPPYAAVKAKIAAIRKIAINVRLFFDSDARITVVQPCRHSFWNASYIEKRSRIDCAFHEFSRLDATVMLNGY